MFKRKKAPDKTLVNNSRCHQITKSHLILLDNTMCIMSGDDNFHNLLNNALIHCKTLCCRLTSNILPCSKGHGITNVSHSQSWYRYYESSNGVDGLVVSESHHCIMFSISRLNYSEFFLLIFWQFLYSNEIVSWIIKIQYLSSSESELSLPLLIFPCWFGLTF